MFWWRLSSPTLFRGLIMATDIHFLREIVDDLNERYGNEVSNPCSHTWADGVDFIFWYDVCLWDSDNHSGCDSFVKDYILKQVNILQYPALEEYRLYLHEELKHIFREDSDALEKVDDFFEEEEECLVKGCKF